MTADQLPADIVEDAIREALHREGQTLIGWVLVTASLHDGQAADCTDYATLAPVGQPYHATYGLLTMAPALLADASHDPEE